MPFAVLLVCLAASAASAPPSEPKLKSTARRSGAARPAKPAAPAVAPRLPLAPPEELVEARKIGGRLLNHYRAGTLRLARRDRERRQLHQLAARGYCLAPDGDPVRLSRPLLRTLDRLAARSTPGKPLVLLSLYRPLSPHRPREPHGNGTAIDIAAYGGYRIHSGNRRECVDGVLAVVKALRPGSYRLGLPKPPGTDPLALLPPPRRPHSWPFFPAPVPKVIDLLGIRVVAPRLDRGRVSWDRRGRLRPAVARWENERYAPFSDIGSRRVRATVTAMRRRGANVHRFFPDALDHLHLDVKPDP